MEQDLFTYLPSEITIDILSRLPVRTVMRCKCVGKSWRNLIETHEFVKSYKSFPSLAIFRRMTTPNPYKSYELEDVLNHDNNSYTSSSCKEAFNFDFPHHTPIHSSVDGWLFLCHNYKQDYNHLILCNPVTHEYINLPNPNPQPGITTEWWDQLDCLGFGVSKTSGQYKLVRVYSEKEHYDGPHCQVYTLGTGSWRSINVPRNIFIVRDIISPGGAFLNGNLHWLALSLKGCPWIISCFDLESELFTTLSIPLDHDLDDRPKPPKSPCCISLSALRGYSLCLCDAEPDHEIVIWLMKENGDDKSWTKQYAIPKIGPLSSWHAFVRVIKVFNNGVVLLTKIDSPKIVFYSNETKTFKENNVIESIDCYSIGAVCYAPSFLQLKTLFPVENVCSF